MSKDLEQAKEEYNQALMYNTSEDALIYASYYIHELEREVKRLTAGLDIALQLQHDAKQETAEIRKEVDSYTVARVEELEKELEKAQLNKVYIAYDDGTLVGVFRSVKDAQGASTNYISTRLKNRGLKEAVDLTAWQQEVSHLKFPIERELSAGNFKWEQWIDEHTVEKFWE